MNSNKENLDAGSRAKDKPALPMGEVIQIDQTLVQKHLRERQKGSGKGRRGQERQKGSGFRF